MLAPFETAAELVEEKQSFAEASSGVVGSKDGRGIGHLVDGETITNWLNDYLRSHPVAPELEQPVLLVAFQFGVRAESRYAGQSFVEGEPEIRSE
jgi:hypothetical protein